LGKVFIAETMYSLNCIGSSWGNESPKIDVLHLWSSLCWILSGNIDV